MSAEKKEFPASLPDDAGKHETDQRSRNGDSNASNRHGMPDKNRIFGKPIHISQKEAQSIPADKDADDPVSP